MTPTEALLFMSNEGLVEAMQDCADNPDREEAHRDADEILVIALLRAVDGELPGGHASALVLIYRQLDRWFG